MLRNPLWLLSLAALLVACSTNGDTPSPQTTTTPAFVSSGVITVPAGQPVDIGMSVALSGDQVSLGTDMADAADLAARDFGREIRGHAIRVVRKDDRCTDAERAVAVAREFIASRALAGVIGPMCTTGAQAANRVYADARTIHISPSVTRIELSSGDDRYFFRTVWRDDAQARVQASYARDALKAATAIVLDDGDPYGAGLADQFVAAFAAAEGQVMSRERVSRGTTDFSSLVREIVSVNPDLVVYEGLNPEGALFVKALRTGGYGGAFMGPDGLLSVRDFLFTAGDQADGAILTGGASPDQAFTDRFTAAFGRPPGTPFVLQSHDAVTTLLQAVESVATEDDDGNLLIDREKLAEAVRSRTVAGLTGTIRFDENGDRAGTSPAEVGLAIYRVTGGRFELVP